MTESVKTGHIYIFISIYSDIFLGDSDDGSTGVIVGGVVGGIMGIISVAVIVMLSMILWHHCKRHKEKNTPGSYTHKYVCIANLSFTLIFQKKSLIHILLVCIAGYIQLASYCL